MTASESTSSLLAVWDTDPGCSSVFVSADPALLFLEELIAAWLEDGEKRYLK